MGNGTRDMRWTLLHVCPSCFLFFQFLKNDGHCKDNPGTRLQHSMCPKKKKLKRIVLYPLVVSHADLFLQQPSFIDLCLFSPPLLILLLLLFIVSHADLLPLLLLQQPSFFFFFLLQLHAYPSFLYLFLSFPCFVHLTREDMNKRGKEVFFLNFCL